MSTSLKIAIVTPVFLPYRGGIGNVAWHQARLLGERGEDVTVLSPDYGYHSPFRPSPYPLPKGEGTTPPLPLGEGRGEGRKLDGFKVDLIKPILQYGNAAWVPSLKKRLGGFSAKGGPASGWDVVILQYPFFGGAGAVYQAKKKYNFKLIVYYHMDVVATLRQGFGWSSSLKGLIFKYNTKFFLPRLIKAADLVLASSEDYARHSSLGKYWQSLDKFQVLPIGVDLNRFVFSDAPRERLIIFVGGLDKAHYFKGAGYLIRAIALVRHAELVSASSSKEIQIPKQVRDDGFKLVIAGQGELMERYKKLAQDLGLADKVEFVGGVSDEELVKLYQRAAVTVLPSIDQSEAFGIVLAESMACGTPVIASDLPGVRSVFENRVSGFTVPPRDSQALAERIQFMLDNPDQARQMGRAGRRLVEERYNWEVIGEKFLTAVSYKL